MSNKRKFSETCFEDDEEDEEDEEVLISDAGDTVENAYLFDSIQFNPPNHELIEQTISQQAENEEAPSATIVPKEISTITITLPRPPVEDCDAAVTVALEAAGPSNAAPEVVQGTGDTPAQQITRRPPKKKVQKNHGPVQDRGKLNFSGPLITYHGRRKNKMMAKWEDEKDKYDKEQEERLQRGEITVKKKFKRQEPLTRAITACDRCKLYKSKCEFTGDRPCSQCEKSNSWCTETNPSTGVVHFRGLKKDQEEKIHAFQHELDGLKKREQEYRKEIEKLKEQLCEWRIRATKEAWVNHGLKPPPRNDSLANHPWGNHQFPSPQTLATPNYTPLSNSRSPVYRSNYGGKGTAQIMTAGNLDPNQSSRQLGLGNVVGSSQAAFGYPSQQSGGFDSLPSCTQLVQIQPDTALSADNSYSERIPPALDSQMDGPLMPHDPPSIQYNTLYGLQPSVPFASQYPAPSQILQPHNNQMGYYATPTPAIVQAANQVKLDSSYAYQNLHAEEVPSTSL
ncbi:hypothetical protein BDV26DRAFT_239179 [Aspergillus bertholletiae]|uniref:Zn(2)-C6 fungal-type domain-containing protein n=1 Tax=Aspergillus bertholletiae TaxID=1226010 RepID=A0A5N7B595_9EURO|nr:hypothetical protein BDV26DRAFT_239179 [Aspergillus bertholletiae]